jgi:hypothetical protein
VTGDGKAKAEYQLSLLPSPIACYTSIGTDFFLFTSAFCSARRRERSFFRFFSLFPCAS